MLTHSVGWREARVSVQEDRQQAQTPAPAATVSLHRALGCVHTSLDHTQPFCFIIIRIRGNLCFQIKETHSAAYHRPAALSLELVRATGA
jgi:hypothetical protein